MNSKNAIKIMLLIVSVITIFHLCILLKIIPYEITWGGRLKNDTEMYMFEGISILVNLVLGLTLLIKGKYVKQLISLKIVNVILWIFLILFALNTIGNMLAETTFEKSFAVVTLFLSLLIGVILKSKRNEHTVK